MMTVRSPLNVDLFLWHSLLPLFWQQRVPFHVVLFVELSNSTREGAPMLVEAAWCILRRRNEDNAGLHD